MSAQLQAVPTEATRISRLPPPQRPEVEHALPALAPLAHLRALPWPQCLWQQAAPRKSVILLVLVAAWRLAVRLTDNDPLLPTTLATARASGHGPTSGELLEVRSFKQRYAKRAVTSPMYEGQWARPQRSSLRVSPR